MADRFSDLLIDFYFKRLEHINSFDLVFLTKPSWNLPAQSIIETLDGVFIVNFEHISCLVLIFL